MNMRHKILIVDDEPLLRALLADYLTDVGYLPYTAENSMQALENLKAEPDLILLDGGKGHVSAVQPVLEAYGLDIPLFGMVKDNKHRTRAIAGDGGEIAIHANRQVFTLISLIQDEVHRFAIGYHRQSRKKKPFLPACFL